MEKFLFKRFETFCKTRKINPTDYKQVTYTLRAMERAFEAGYNEGMKDTAVTATGVPFYYECPDCGYFTNEEDKITHECVLKQ